MSLAFLVLLPMGALLVRAFSFKSLVYVHAIAQISFLMLALSGFALGVWYIRSTKQAFKEQPHFMLGLAVIIMLLLQPVFGFLHHAMYVQYKKKTFMTFIHISFGRIIFILALANGALGLKLGRSLRGGMEAATIAYSVVAAIMGTLYISVLLFAWRKGGKVERPHHGRADRRVRRRSGIETSERG